jgi:hypothetical protein
MISLIIDFVIGSPALLDAWRKECLLPGKRYSQSGDSELYGLAPALGVMKTYKASW